MNLSKKLLINSAIYNFLIVVIGCFIFIGFLYIDIVNSSKEELRRINEIFIDNLVEHNSNHAEMYMETIEKNALLKEYIRRKNIAGLDNMLVLYSSDIIEVYDKNNHIIFEKDNDNKLFPIIKVKIQQQIVKDENNRFFISDRQRGLFYFERLVIEDKGEELGKLVIGFHISKDRNLDLIKERYFMDSEMFSYETKINSTLYKKTDASRIDPEIIDSIKKSGQFLGRISIEGKRYIASYLPIIQDKEQIAVIGVLKRLDNIYKDFWIKIMYVILGAFLLFIIKGIYLYRNFKKKYITPLADLSKEMLEMGNEGLQGPSKVNMGISKNEMDFLKNTFRYMKSRVIESEKELKKRLYNDSNTGLYNQNFLRDKFCSPGNEAEGKICHKDISNDIELGIFISVDNIERLTNKLNYFAVEEIKIKSAEFLKEFCEKKELILFRFDINTFLILKEVFHPVTLEEIVEGIREEINVEYSINHRKIPVTLSMGSCYSSTEVNTMEKLVKNCGIALSVAKSKGTNVHKLFNKRIMDMINEVFEIEHDLKEALEKNQFFLVYQPKYNYEKDKIYSFEALIRWVHPQKGFIPPDKFIGIAEQNGMIIDIGKWVFEEAVKFIEKINKLGKERYTISINLSVRQLTDNLFIEYLQEEVENGRLNTEYLEFEITESVFIESYEDTLKKLNRLKQLGFKLSLDDFGTGYSSLNYLKNLPIDIIKIDKAFIGDIFNEKNFLEDIIKIGKKLGLEIVAEGIETETEFELLKKYRCDNIQGYYISKPKKIEEILEALNGNGNLRNDEG